MKIVTTGSQYLDIDGYAGCVAYAELLNLQGLQARAVSMTPTNSSIPPIVLNWHAPLDTSYEPSADDTYTLIDVSNPDYFESFAAPDRIDAVIDHHPGFEGYWHERIGEAAIIERVGAACTQVFELWEHSGLTNVMSETSARLLICGILDNTLNFGADITSNRDKHAYVALQRIANFPADWPQKYFSACQNMIINDLSSSIANDIKVLNFRTFRHTVAFGQLALWDAGSTIQQSFETIKATVSVVQPHWFMNVISLNDNRSYFISDDNQIKTWLSSLLNLAFAGNVAAADRLWLRKEVMKADIDTSNR